MIVQRELSSAPEHLSEQQISQMRRDGYLAFKDVLSTEEVEKCKAALSELVQRVASGEHEKNGPFWTLPGSRFGVQLKRTTCPKPTTKKSS
jgi:hypothetical protein